VIARKNPAGHRLSDAPESVPGGQPVPPNPVAEEIEALAALLADVVELTRSGTPGCGASPESEGIPGNAHRPPTFAQVGRKSGQCSCYSQGRGGWHWLFGVPPWTRSTRSGTPPSGAWSAGVIRKHRSGAVYPGHLALIAEQAQGYESVRRALRGER
jgi:hypothetical protein